MFPCGQGSNLMCTHRKLDAHVTFDFDYYMPKSCFKATFILGSGKQGNSSCTNMALNLDLY